MMSERYRSPQRGKIQPLKVPETGKIPLVRRTQEYGMLSIFLESLVFYHPNALQMARSPGHPKHYSDNLTQRDPPSTRKSDQ